MSHPDYRKVSLETVTKCYGNCDGCTLSEIERRDDRGPQVDALSWATGFANKALSLVRKKDADGGAFVVFGQGEHLSLGHAEDIADMAKAASPQALTINEFTSALLMPNSEARSLLQRVYDRSLAHPVALLPNIVFSPRKVLQTGFWAEYLKNIETAVEIFGISDFTVNIGPDVVNLISPKEFHQLMRLSGIRSMEINLIPIDSTAAMMQLHWPRIIGWMTELIAHWYPDRRHYRLAFPINMAQLIERSYGLTIQEGLGLVEKHFANEIYLDLGGFVYLAGSGGAGVTVPFYKKNGYAPIAAGYPEFDDAMDDRLYAGARQIGLRMTAAHMRFPACRECPYLVSCIASGFTPALTQFRPDVQKTGAACPLGLLDLMVAAKATLEKSSVYDLDIFHGHVAQKGYKDHVDSEVLYRPEDFSSSASVGFHAAVNSSLLVKGGPKAGMVSPVERRPAPRFPLDVSVACSDLRALDWDALARAIDTLRTDARGDDTLEGDACDLNVGPANPSALSAEDWQQLGEWAARVIGQSGSLAMGCTTQEPAAMATAIRGMQDLSGRIGAAMFEWWTDVADFPEAPGEAAGIAFADCLAAAFPEGYIVRVRLDHEFCAHYCPEIVVEWLVRTRASNVFFVVTPDSQGGAVAVYEWLMALEKLSAEKRVAFVTNLAKDFSYASRSLMGGDRAVVEGYIRSRMSTCFGVDERGAVYVLQGEQFVANDGQPLPSGAAAGGLDAINWSEIRRSIGKAVDAAMTEWPACADCAFSPVCSGCAIPRVRIDGSCPSGARPLFAYWRKVQ